MGVATIGLPESYGGGGGSVLDQAVALEACAHELVPGPLLVDRGCRPRGPGGESADAAAVALVHESLGPAAGDRTLLAGGADGLLARRGRRPRGRAST